MANIVTGKSSVLLVKLQPYPLLCFSLLSLGHLLHFRGSDILHTTHALQQPSCTAPFWLGGRSIGCIHSILQDEFCRNPKLYVKTLHQGLFFPYVKMNILGRKVNGQDNRVCCKQSSARLSSQEKSHTFYFSVTDNILAMLVIEKTMGANLAKPLTREQFKWYKLYGPIQLHRYLQNLAIIF